MKQALDKLSQAEEPVGNASAHLREIEGSSDELGEFYRDILQRLNAVGSYERLTAAAEQMARAERLQVLARRLLGDGRGPGGKGLPGGVEAGGSEYPDHRPGHFGTDAVAGNERDGV